MKKHTLIGILIASSLVVRASAGTSPTPTASPVASPGPGCKAASWSPEEYRFYGAKDTIVENLGKIRVELSERRIFVQITQGESSANVKLYEQQEDGTFTVTEWATKQTSHLLAEIDKAIVANKGVNCVGEQVKGVLAKELGKGRVVKAVSAPASLRAAFAHSIERAQGDFIGFVFIVLC
jgi:hypothetical protein